MILYSIFLTLNLFLTSIELLAICRDSSAFEYILSSSAPAVLSRPRRQPQSSRVAALIAHAAQDEDQDEDQSTDNKDSKFIDIDTLDFDEFVEPRPVSMTRLGLQRLEGVVDAYQPGILPLQLCQTNPFSRQQDDKYLGTNVYELAGYEMPATTEEMRQIEEDEADEEALSQTIEVVTRAGRARKATQKALESAGQVKPPKRGPKSDRGGRGGRGGQRGSAKV
jgi:hypothetical protein